jgi:hypothetical protein
VGPTLPFCSNLWILRVVEQSHSRPRSLLFIERQNLLHFDLVSLKRLDKSTKKVPNSPHLTPHLSRCIGILRLLSAAPQTRPERKTMRTHDRFPLIHEPAGQVRMRNCLCGFTVRHKIFGRTRPWSSRASSCANLVFKGVRLSKRCRFNSPQFGGVLETLRSCHALRRLPLWVQP